MKWLIFSDVHANWFGLQHVLRFARQHHITRLVCLGDLVGYNALPNECVDSIRHQNIPTVKGNHEALLLNEIAGFGRIAEKAQHSLRITRQIISAENRAFLKQLPFLLPLENDIAAVHANFFDLQRTVNSVEKAKSQFEEMRKRGLRVVFFGHTHRPEIYTADVNLKQIQRITDWEELSHFQLDPEALYLVNPGTVGVARHGLPHSFVVFDVRQGIIAYKAIQFADHEVTQLHRRNKEVFGGITWHRIPAITREKLRKWYYRLIS